MTSDIHMKTSNNRVGIPKWLHVLSFIPNIGMLYGLIILILGIVNKNKSTIIWGIVGILFTPIFWITVLVAIDASGFNSQSNILFTKNNLNEMVKDLEYYRVKNGSFPDSLGQLRNQNNFFDDSDLSSENIFHWKLKSQRLYYKKINDTSYILQAKGKDTILNTEDDIFPDLK